MPKVIGLDAGGGPIWVDDMGNPIPAPMPDDGSGARAEAAAYASELAADPADPAEINMPAEDRDPAPLAAGDSVGFGTTDQAGQSGNVSVSTEAVDPVIDSYSRSGVKAVDSQMPRVVANVNSALAPFAAAETQIADDRAAAQELETRTAMLMAEAQAAGDKQIAQLTERFAVAEQQGRQASQARAAQAAAEHKARLLAYSAAEVNPSRLWQSMERPAKFVTLMAAFVTDFLGAKGIKTSAMDHLNQAIERDISAQVENIRKQGQVTEQFRALWDMAIQDGATEAEARSVVNGYYLAGAQRAVIADVSQYGGQLAQANGAEAQSAIAQELVAHLATIENQAYTRAQSEMDRLLDSEFKTQQLAISRSSVAQGWANSKLAREEFEFKKKMAEAPVGPDIKDLTERIVFDPDHPEQAIGTAASKEDAAKIKEDLVDSAALRRSIANVRDKMQKVYNGPGKGLVNDAAELDLRAAWTDLTTEIAHSKSGTQYAEEFRKAVGDIIPLETWSNPNVDALMTYSNQLLSQLDKTQNTIGGRLNGLTPAQAELVRSGAVPSGSTYQLDKERRLEADKLRSEGHGKPSDHSPLKDAAGKVTSKRANRVVSVDRDLAEDAAAAGLAAYEPTSGEAKRPGGKSGRKGDNRPGMDDRVRYIAETSPIDDPYLPEWAVGVRDLWLVAQDSDVGETERGQAKELLRQYAGTAGNDRALLSSYYYNLLDEPNQNRPR